MFLLLVLKDKVRESWESDMICVEYFLMENAYVFSELFRSYVKWVLTAETKYLEKVDIFAASSDFIFD